jgi:hypothetical protein
MNLSKLTIIILGLFLLNVAALTTFNNLSFTIVKPLPGLNLGESVTIPQLYGNLGGKINNLMIATCVLMGVLLIYYLIIIKLIKFSLYPILEYMGIILLLLCISGLSIAATSYYISIDYDSLAYNKSDSGVSYRTDNFTNTIINRVLQYSAFGLHR